MLEFTEMEVQVEMEDAVLQQEVKTEIEALEEADTYHVYHDGDMYEGGAELYQEVEIGHPEITMYEVENQEDAEILYKVEDIKGEILYEVEDEKGEIFYEDGQSARILYQNGETAEILYEAADKNNVHYEEVYEEIV